MEYFHNTLLYPIVCPQTFNTSTSSYPTAYQLLAVNIILHLQRREPSPTDFPLSALSFISAQEGKDTLMIDDRVKDVKKSDRVALSP